MRSASLPRSARSPEQKIAQPTDSDQLKYLATVGLKKAHTDIHQALDCLVNDGSTIEAKRKIVDAIAQASQALSVI